jgi:hypothetical protein
MFIERAKALSKANNGIRIYVFPFGDDFTIRDTETAKLWMKEHHFINELPTQKAVYYTPTTNICKHNGIYRKSFWEMIKFW